MKFPFILRRNHNNEVARLNKVIHAHYVTIQSLKMTVSNLTEEIRLSKPKRDSKGRFTK